MPRIIATTADAAHLNGEDCGGAWWGGCRLCAEEATEDVTEELCCDDCGRPLLSDLSCDVCDDTTWAAGLDVRGRDAEERALRIGAA